MFSAAAEKLLEKIEKYKFKQFEAENPCSNENAKVQFHRMRTLVRGLVVKGFMYRKTGEAAEHYSIEKWPPQAEITQILEGITPGSPQQKWLDDLEILRDGVFELSRNPLMVWERLKQSNTAG